MTAYTIEYHDGTFETFRSSRVEALVERHLDGLLAHRLVADAYVRRDLS